MFSTNFYSKFPCISGDGTFKICSYPWYQVFIVHASVGPSSSVPVMFSLLPDKTRRSYDDMFNGLNVALKKRDLQLSSTYFMSDFEINIRESFVDHFPDIIPKDSSYIMILTKIIIRNVEPLKFLFLS